MKTRKIMIVCCIILMLGMALGCKRYIDSQNPVRSLPDAPPAPISLQARIDNQAVTLSWELRDSVSASRFRVYMADSTAQAYVLRDSTMSYTRTITGLLVNQKYFFRVATVRTDGIEGEWSLPVSVRAGILGIAIENNDAFTRQRDITVELVSPLGLTQVILSENPQLSGALPQSAEPPVHFTVSDGDGLKTVYARFVFIDGAQSGTPVSDTIRLDTQARIDSVYFAPASSAQLRADSVITFFLVTKESGGKASISVRGLVDDLALYEGVTKGTYSARYTIPANASVSDELVRGTFVDAAGNSALSVSASKLITIVNSPRPVQLITVAALSASEISLSWTQADQSGFAQYVIYRSLDPTVTSTSTFVQGITNRSTTNYLDTGLVADTPYYYRVFVYNQSGAEAQSSVGNARTLPAVPPAAVLLAGVYNSAGSSAQLSWSEYTGQDFRYYMINRISGVDTTTIAIKSAAGETTHSDPLSSAGSYTYVVYVMSRQGLSSPSNAVIVNRP